MSFNPNLILPRAEDSEKAALGAILLEAKHLATLLAYVRIEDFALSSHREILRAVDNLKKRQRTPDLISVVEQLRQAGKLESVGGAAYVASLIDNVPDRPNVEPNVETYARNIRDASRARGLHAASTLASTSIEQGRPVDEVLDRLQEAQLQFTRVQIAVLIVEDFRIEEVKALLR